MGSVTNHNDQDNNSVKILIINYLLCEQNSSACATRLLVHFLDIHLHDYDVKPPNATFCGGHDHTNNSTPAGPNRCNNCKF